jgi:hypothetical protein
MPIFSVPIVATLVHHTYVELDAADEAAARAQVKHWIETASLSDRIHPPAPIEQEMSDALERIAENIVLSSRVDYEDLDVPEDWACEELDDEMDEPAGVG